jgi:hypothetical protein
MGSTSPQPWKKNRVRYCRMPVALRMMPRCENRGSSQRIVIRFGGPTTCSNVPQYVCSQAPVTFCRSLVAGVFSGSKTQAGLAAASGAMN